MVLFSFSISRTLLHFSGQTENVDGHSTQWVVWSGKSASSASVKYTLEAKTAWEKRSWVS